MAEIFVVNKSASLVGQYVSDLPVINEAPVSRQIGFYLGEAVSLTSDTLSNMVAYLAQATCTDGALSAGELLSTITLTDSGATTTDQVSSITGNVIITGAEYDAGISASTYVARYLWDLLDNGESLDGFEAGINADIALDDGSGTAISAVDIFAGANSVDLAGLIRVACGMAFSTSDYTFAETGIVGNHRLIGGKRRIYLRDRVEASLGEGFLRTFTDSGDLVVYLADGSVL